MKKINVMVFLMTLLVNNINGQIVNLGEMSILPSTLVSIKSNFSNTIEATLINDGDLVVFSDFTNDGLVTFSEENGNTRFEGDSRQRILSNSTSEFSKFNNIVFNNKSEQPAFSLVGEISVFKNSNFLRGIVRINEFDGAIVYENKSTHSNTQDKSHVDGYVVKKGDTEFLCPIGNDLYFRQATIFPTASKNIVKPSYMGKYFFENSDLIHSHSSKDKSVVQIDDQEYWTMDHDDLKLSKINEESFIITLSWNESTTPAFIWQDLDPSKNNEGTIAIVRWNTQKKAWIDEGGTIEIGDNGVGTGTVTSISKISGNGIFTLAKKIKNKNEVVNDIVVYNAISPNNDGKNDYLSIEGLKKYSNNNLMIFNRWGVKVYDTDNYDSNGNVFRGYSEGRSTISSNSKLPTGTYFYILRYEMKNGTTSRNIEKSGYLYLSDN